MDKIKLVVYNEYCLGYINPQTPDTVSTLADSVIKGAPFRTFCDPYYIRKSDKVRLASKKDFDDFRVHFSGYDNPEIYEYNEVDDNRTIKNMETNEALNPICPECGSIDTEILDNENVAICHHCWLEWPYIAE